MIRKNNNDLHINKKQANSKFKPIRSLSLPHLAAKEILSRIVEEQISEGDYLSSERELADDFGVTRTTVRQALQLLSKYGIITVKPGSGAYVNNQDYTNNFEKLIFQKELGISFNLDLIKNSLEMRRLLELFMVKKVLEKITQDDEVYLSGLLKRQKKLCGDTEKFELSDREFHLVLAKISGNAVLASQLNSLYDLSLERREEYFSLEDRCEQANNQHIELFEAIKARNLEKAISKMEHHLKFAEKAWLSNAT